MRTTRQRLSIKTPAPARDYPGPVVKKLWQGVRRKLERYGLRGAVCQQALQILQRALGLKILVGVHVARADPSFLEQPEGYLPGFLSAGQLRGYARDPASEMTPAFVEQALVRHDECYALRAGEELAAYGWYSFRSTPVGLGDLELHFGADHVYMYKGFTDARHRGRRLHAVGMTRALQHYLGAGYKGLVSYVEATNFDSLKSCERMGYEVFGLIFVLRLFGCHIALSSPGCARFGFRLRRASAAASDLGFGKN
jgi:hypothetical protein